MQTMAMTATPPLRRVLDRRAFDEAYARLVLSNEFTEDRAYYRHYIDRYRRTLGYLERLPLPRPASILEIGGGQIALLAQELFGDRAIVGDISRDFAESVLRHGVEFVKYDLLQDTLPERHAFDLIVLCEVVEHLPVPLYTVLERLLPALKDGGYVLITTPNLYRLRNVVRLALGREIFCPFFYPEESTSLGHVIEFSERHLRWQLQRSQLADINIEFAQLSNCGSTVRADLLRKVASPLLLVRPNWRDGLVAWARKPDGECLIRAGE